MSLAQKPNALAFARINFFNLEFFFVEEVIKKYKTQTGRGSGKRVRELSPPPEDNFWFSDILKEEDQFNVALSGKLVLLCEILKRASEVSDKVLLFSQSLMSLTLIEDTLAMITEAKKNNWQVCRKC